MVNGSVAKTTNILVAIIVTVCLIGVIILGLQNDDIPGELSMVLSAGIGFLVGTKFTPITTYSPKSADKLSPDDTVVVKDK